MFDILGAQKFSVEWVDSFSAISESAWQELFPAQVEGRWWYALLEKSKLEKQFKFFYAVVKSKNEIVALAPTFLFDVPIELVLPEDAMPVIEVASAFMPNLKYQRTLFIGSPCAEEGAVGVKKGMRFSDMAGLLQDAADKKARQLGAVMIVWKDLPESFSEDMNALAQEKKMFCVAQTYEKGKTKFEKLGIEYFREAGKLPESYFVLVREKENCMMVAFMLCFKLDGKIVNKFIGLDYSRPLSWSLYFRLWEASLEWVVKQNCPEFLSGQTGYRFKIDVGNSLVPLNNYCKHTNPMVLAVFATHAKEVSWATLDDDLKVYLTAHPEAGRQARQPAPV
jgi:hypothetical protein